MNAVRVNWILGFFSRYDDSSVENLLSLFHHLKCHAPQVLSSHTLLLENTLKNK